MPNLVMKLLDFAFQIQKPTELLVMIPTFALMEMLVMMENVLPIQLSVNTLTHANFNTEPATL